MITTPSLSNQILSHRCLAIVKDNIVVISLKLELFYIIFHSFCFSKSVCIYFVQLPAKGGNTSMRQTFFTFLRSNEHFNLLSQAVIAENYKIFSDLKGIQNQCGVGYKHCFIVQNRLKLLKFIIGRFTLKRGRL